ncbi:CPCC family cysteine-rich protein [Paenibacillus sp. FJAT-27812]|uniref:CPCC family cysteine-rich protein n=1 Tax=Paenibacillus sp. FJAT-27812 TaxID=1684143 RepID=UPI000B27EE63|nr:CPCC family cysteine-rich protein [Paenibacillus sp. FJAT-27812]
MRVQCPCCDFFTFGSKEEAFFEICEVCFWQYDEVAHDKPEINIGANHISLNQAKGNYRDFGAYERKFKDSVREPYKEEYPENNLPR